MAEQKLMGRTKKVSRTKIGERNKKKVSGTKIGERNKNSGTKIGGQNKKKVGRAKIGEQNKNSRTKTAEQKLFIIPSHPNKNWWGQCKCKKVSGTKIGGHCQPLGDGDPKCKCKKVSGTKIAEQKLVGTLGHWVTGTPSASAKRSAEQK